MTDQTYFSQRTGANPHPDGLPLPEIAKFFLRAYQEFETGGYFVEAFGFECVDEGHIAGRVNDVDLEILLAIRKKELWPIPFYAEGYGEDDLFDMMEFLFQHVSKPIDGDLHSWNECGMHWKTFSRKKGQNHYRSKMNQILAHYEKPFGLSPEGQVLFTAEVGFEPIFEADVPSEDPKVVSRIEAAVSAYRRHRSTVEDRRQAVRDLADILEYLRPQVKSLLTTQDEKDLFELANRFGIRHHNDKQKTEYDAALWLSWMFYYYLATIHVLLRRLKHDVNS